MPWSTWEEYEAMAGYVTSKIASRPEILDTICRIYDYCVEPPSSLVPWQNWKQWRRAWFEHTVYHDVVVCEKMFGHNDLGELFFI